MCCMPGQSWAKLSLSYFESFSGCEVSRQARKCQHGRARELSLQGGCGVGWHLTCPWDSVSPGCVWCWLPVSHVSFDAGWLGCSSFCSKIEVQLLKQKWPHLMDTLSKGDLLLGSLHSSPTACPLSFFNGRMNCLHFKSPRTLCICLAKIFPGSFSGLWIFSLS